MDEQLSGRNRPCPWMDEIDAPPAPWRVAVHRDRGPDAEHTDRDLERDHPRMRNAEALRRQILALDVAGRLAGLHAGQYPEYAPQIAAFFGWGDLVGTRNWPGPNRGRPAVHAERFPVLSVLELARGSWLHDMLAREGGATVDPSWSWVPYRDRWGQSVREYDMAGLRHAIEAGHVVGDSLRRAQANLETFEAGRWPASFLGPNVGSGTYQLTGGEGLNVLAAPRPGAPVNGRVVPGQTVNHAREFAGEYVRLLDRVGWLDRNRLTEVGA